MPHPLAIHLNQLDPTAFREALTRCCGATRWVEAMLAERPFLSDAAVFSASERHWQTMQRDDILEAFSHHPKIGSDIQSLRERFPHTHQWSGQEQAAVQEASEKVLQDLADGNNEYDKRFGYIFIVCATGKTASEMLALLQARLHNPPETELSIAAAEQAKITIIRLNKLRDSLPQGDITMRSPITTHALDTHLGKPAADLPIQLSKRQDDGAWEQIASGITNADGRIADLLAPGSLQAGTYQMRFDTGAYFAARQTPTFYPEVLVTFAIHATDEHYHVPLLISPFGFSTYRGS